MWMCVYESSRATSQRFVHEVESHPLAISWLVKKMRKWEKNFPDWTISKLYTSRLDADGAMVKSPEGMFWMKAKIFRDDAPEVTDGNS